MATIQAASRRARASTWIKKHKVVSVFLALFLALVLYLVITEVVMQVQIHFERRDYFRAQTLVNDVVDGVTLPGSPVVKKFSDCSYTSNGAVFETRFLGCETGVSITYSDTSLEVTKNVRDLLREEMKRQGVQSHENPKGMGAHDLSVDVFDVGKVGCSLSTTFYEKNVPGYDRDQSVPNEGEVSLTIIDCAGSAKAEYFPVTKN